MAGALRKPIGYLGRKQPFDIILSSWLYPDSCAVALLGNNLPFVSIAQGSDVHHYLKMPLRRSIIVKAMQRASGIITRSAALAQLLTEAGLPNEKLHPVYNGIDFTQFKPADKSAARKALGLPTAASIILFVGNFLPVKNPLLLIHAHAKLRNTHLVTVGGGPMEADVRSLAASLGTMNRITFAGRRTAGDVARYMQAADVLVLPSKNEGVPNVILEAFACGLPVVASRVGGITEVHHSDFLGQLVVPGNLDSLVNAIERVITVPADLDQIHRHALQFSWEAAAASYSMLLRSLLR